MKILQINNQHHLKGGAHKVYFDTGKLLEQHGHDVYYFSQKNNENINYKLDNFWPAEINYRNLSLSEKFTSVRNFIFNVDAYSKLSKFIDYVKPDIAHIHLFMGGLSSSILKALKEKNIPIVHSVHDYRLICPAYTLFDRKNMICERCIDNKYFRCAIRRCALDRRTSSSIMLSIDAYYRSNIINPLFFIDKFIFVSNFSKDKHIEFNESFISNSEVLYNFSDINYNIENYPKDYFLYFGRISREKGLENIVEVFNELGYQLYIVGDGPDLPVLKTKSKTNIKYYGFKQANELYSLISESKFVILPSIWYENNPLTIIEAFALNKPVIGSAVGGIPELIGSERGFTFSTNNLLEIKEIIKKAAALSINDYLLMQKQVKKFFNDNLSKEQYYKKLLSIYKNTIERKDEKSY